jgi:hypothetical protein
MGKTFDKKAHKRKYTNEQKEQENILNIIRYQENAD